MMSVKIFVKGKQKNTKKPQHNENTPSLDANFSDEALSTDPDSFGQTIFWQRGRSTRAHATKYSTTIPAVMAPSERRKRRSTGHTARCVSIRDPPRRSFRHATFLHQATPVGVNRTAWTGPTPAVLSLGTDGTVPSGIATVTTFNHDRRLAQTHTALLGTPAGTASGTTATGHNRHGHVHRNAAVLATGRGSRHHGAWRGRCPYR